MNKDILINNNLHFMSFSKLDTINLFTFKPYNFRFNLISEEEINCNFIKLQNSLNYKFRKIVKSNQTHTNNVEVVTEENINDEFKDTDGLITNLKNVALITNLADCQGILLYDKEKQVIGNIHSGWKGTLNRIVKNAINLMISNYSCDPKNIEAYICPSIMKCCFEVDSDVKDLFIDEFKDIDINSCIELGDVKDNKQKYYIDTISINKQVMMNSGLKEENIISADMCSKCNHELIHSHRSDGVNSGRNIALICLK
ncbi:MAG: peptidoglycan editing factor PgeF [Lactobacillales bacterium]|nr:peptidoglycan editing factor PgeF [Lactobacillales bacterium]